MVDIAEDIYLDNVSSVSMVDFVVLEMEDVYLQISDTTNPSKILYYYVHVSLNKVKLSLNRVKFTVQ